MVYPRRHETNEPPNPPLIMATTYPIHSSAHLPADESRVVHTTYLTLKFLFGLVPIVAGADKFFNLLAHWESYLNPLALRSVPMSAMGFMRLVGVIEIAAGILVFLKPPAGGFVVMAWLIAIALQLVFWGHYLDIAVRDWRRAHAGAIVVLRRKTRGAENRGADKTLVITTGFGFANSLHLAACSRR